MKRLAVVASASLALLVGVWGQSAHAVPTTMSFTGKLNDSSGPVTGAVQVIVKIYDDANVGSGTEVWTETHTTTADAGLVYLELGNTTALDEGVFDGRDLWLDITVNGDQQSPRIPFNVVPYATRAAVADSADTLGTLGPTDVALAGHDHAGVYAPAGHNHSGTYLPVGATLTCGGTQKVTGLNANGSVICGADVDTNTQNTYTNGTGLTLSSGTFAVDFGTGSNQVARGNHGHAGVYLPLSGSRTCGGTQKVTGINADGSVVCGNDINTDTNTTYTNGTGLSLSSNTFSVNFGTTSSTVARGNHTHASSASLSCTTRSATGNVSANSNAWVYSPTCVSGEFLTGGGCHAGWQDLFINSSRPGSSARWECWFVNNAATTRTSRTAYARCCTVQ